VPRDGRTSEQPARAIGLGAALRKAWGEKVVSLTPRASPYLAAQRKAARGIERRLPEEVGERAFDGLSLLLAMTNHA
jgi:hypothetical protein